ncbi:hypothetical protein ACFQ0M_36760 [Kitasatospora aburaviensis]
MAIIVAFEFPEVTQAQYQESVDRLTGGAGLNSPSDWPVHGLILHAGARRRAVGGTSPRSGSPGRPSTTSRRC